MFLARIDNFKKNAVDHSTATKFGGVLTILFPLAVIGYTIWLAIDYVNSPTTLSTEITSNLNNPQQISMTCWAKKCYMYAGYLSGKPIVSNCYSVGRIPTCQQYTLGQKMTAYTCYSPDPLDGLKVLYEKSTVANDPLACPSNAACTAGNWGYASTDFGLSLNSVLYDEKRDVSVVNYFPISEGMQILTHVKYNLSTVPRITHAFFPNRVDVTPPATNPCTGLAGYNPANIQFVDYKSQPTYIVRTVEARTYGQIFGQIGGIASATLTVFGIMVAIYRYAGRKFCSSNLSETVAIDQKEGQELSVFTSSFSPTSLPSVIDIDGEKVNLLKMQQDLAFLMQKMSHPHGAPELEELAGEEQSRPSVAANSA